MQDQEIVPQPGPGTGTASVSATLSVQQQVALSVKRAALRKSITSGASWLYWIAGLSLVNTIIHASGGSFTFVIGLGFTQVLDALMVHAGPAPAVILVPLELFVAGAYGALGYCAWRRMRWAFITALVIYSLDSLLIVLAMDLIGLAFHALALFSIYIGLRSDGKLREIEALR